MSASRRCLFLLTLAVGCGSQDQQHSLASQPAALFQGVDWSQQTPIDRVGRPLMSLVFIDALATAAGLDHAQMLDAYNAGAPDAPADFIQPIAGTLSLLDAADGQCGNQLGSQGQPDAMRYVPLASMLADDKLYISADDAACNGFLGLELRELSGGGAACGGRTPNDAGIDALYALAMGEGSEALAVDGLGPSSLVVSDSPPFLAPGQ